MTSTTTTVRGLRRPRPQRREMALYRVRVTRVCQLSPHLRRVTFAGQDVGALPFAGPDQRVKLLPPLPGQDRPHVDGRASVREMLSMPEHIRPVIRTYTIRNHRPAASELDIDFALHGDLGPASRWAVAAGPGDEVAIYGPASEYAPPQDTRWQLVVGDESALPAVGAIVESLRRYDRARVIVELADPRDAQQFDTAGEVEVSWLHRGDDVPAHESTGLLDAVRAGTLPAVPSYFWISGESSVVTAVRRHLVNDRGVSADDVNFTGYWRHGHSENDD